ncbi:MAG: STAS domain-containing protein [Chthoniobacterales bacterium]
MIGPRSRRKLILMEISESSVNGIPVLHLKGRLDGAAAPALEEKLTEQMAAGHDRLVFDCQGVEYASSAGLRVFLLAAKQLKMRCGRCGFAALTPALRQVFSLSGFLDILEVHDTVEQAAA